MGNIFIGDSNSKAKAITNAYVGVDGKARKIKQIYVGVNNVARLVWSATKKKYFMITKSSSYISSDTKDCELYSYNQDTKSISLVTNNVVSSYYDALYIPSTENSNYICITKKKYSTSYQHHGFTVYKKQSENSYVEYWNREIRNTLNSSNSVVQSSNCIATDLGLTICCHTGAGKRNAIITPDGQYFLCSVIGADSSTSGNYYDLFIAIYKNNGSGYTYYDKLKCRNIISSSYSVNGYIILNVNNDLSIISATYQYKTTSSEYADSMCIFNYNVSSKTIAFTKELYGTGHYGYADNIVFCSPNMKYILWTIENTASYSIIINNSSATQNTISERVYAAIIKNNGSFMYTTHRSSDTTVAWLTAGYIDSNGVTRATANGYAHGFFLNSIGNDVSDDIDAFSYNMDEENNYFAVRSNGTWYVLQAIYDSNGYFAGNTFGYTAANLIATLPKTGAIYNNDMFYFIKE